MAVQFSDVEAYERYMGRWSRRLAPLFVAFAGVQDGDRVLDDHPVVPARAKIRTTHSLSEIALGLGLQYGEPIGDR